MAKTKPQSMKAKIGLYLRETNGNLVKNHQIKSEADKQVLSSGDFSYFSMDSLGAGL